MREVGVHLQHQVGACLEGCGEARQVRPAETGLARPVQDLNLVELSRQPVGDPAGAVGGVVVHDQHRVRHSHGLQPLSGRANQGLDVLGLVVGREDQPGAGQAAYPSPGMRNSEIAEAFEELASLYELDGAVVYRVVAYRNAAKAIRDSGVSVEDLARQGKVVELAGVGKTIAEKIDALLETGSIPSADKLKAKIPAGLVEITRIPGLGPKRAKLLHDQLGVSSLDDLRRAAEDGSLKDVPGFGKKAEENVLATLAAGADGRPRERVLLSKALTVGEQMVAVLREHPAALRVELAGSARRYADTVKDLDIVAASSDPAALSKAFCALDSIDVVGSSGEAGAKVVTHSGLSARPAHRALGGVRQPAPALHRIGQAQRGSAHGGGAARAARE